MLIELFVSLINNNIITYVYWLSILAGGCSYIAIIL